MQTPHTILMRPRDLVICLDPEYHSVADVMHGGDTRAHEPLESPAMQSLRESIMSHGFLGDKPITVTLIHGLHVVLDGTRRVRVCREYLPDAVVPCCVIETSDTVGASLTRNVSRQSTPLERAHEVSRLLASGRTAEQVAAMLLDSNGVKMTLSTVKRLADTAANLIPEAQECIRRYDAGETSARAIPYYTLESLATRHPTAQAEALRRIIAKRLDGGVVDARAGAAIAAGVAVAPRPTLRQLRDTSASGGLCREYPDVALVLRWAAGDLPESELPRVKRILGPFAPAGLFEKQTKIR